MSKKYFYIHEKSGRKFEVIDIDPEAGTITLKGELSQFTEPWSKEAFREMGYKRITEEVEDEEVE